MVRILQLECPSIECLDLTPCSDPRDSHGPDQSRHLAKRTDGIRYNVTVGRLYKDGSNWKQTESFGRDDLSVLAKVADQAHTFQKQQESE